MSDRERDGNRLRRGCLKEAIGALIMISGVGIVGSPVLDMGKAATQATGIVNAEMPPVGDDVLGQAKSMVAAFRQTSETLARTGRLADISESVNPTLLQLAYGDIDREEARQKRVNKLTAKLQEERSGDIVWRALAGLVVMVVGAVVYRR